jgi:hypothetical protein
MGRREGNKLTAAAVRAASKPGLYSDGHGLIFRSHPLIRRAGSFVSCWMAVLAKWGLVLSTQ